MKCRTEEMPSVAGKLPIESIQTIVQAATSCSVAVREALVLANGQVITLVDPPKLRQEPAPRRVGLELRLHLRNRRQRRRTSHCF